MVMLTLRFDLRNPAFSGVSSSERLRSAVEMVEWAERRAGAVAVSISEHHGSDDGYLPSPLVFAAALAARTSHLHIAIAALIAPFYDPLRLAEDIAVLDALSEGRVDVIVANGYAPHELAMFGLKRSELARRTTETVETLRRAWTGEPFEFRGRTVRVTPTPFRPGGPPIVLGGSSEGAARRAARIADGFVPSTGDCWAAYRDEMQRLGKPDPGEHFDMPVVVTFLADDPDAAWPELVPYFLHEMNAYAAWLEAGGFSGPYRRSTEAELRASGQYRVVTPEQYAEELRAMGDAAFAMLSPMVGGVPPKLAWRCLELYEQKVLPALATT